MGAKLGRAALIAFVALAAWTVAFSIDRDRDVEMPLSPSLRLVEHVHTDRRAYSGMAESTGSIWLPVPLSSEYVTRQGLYRGRTLLWQADALREGMAKAHASPDETRVVLEPALHDRPWRILDVSTGATVDVPPPHEEVAGHDYVFPFTFMRWSGDSRRIEAVVEGTVITPEREQAAYREVWEIGSAGESARLRRCEQHWSVSVSWEGTECGTP